MFTRGRGHPPSGRRIKSPAPKGTVYTLLGPTKNVPPKNPQPLVFRGRKSRLTPHRFPERRYTTPTVIPNTEVSSQDKARYAAHDAILKMIQHHSGGSLTLADQQRITAELTPKKLAQLARSPKLFRDYINQNAQNAVEGEQGRISAQHFSGLLSAMGIHIPYVDRKLSEFIDRAYYSFPGTIRALIHPSDYGKTLEGMAKGTYEVIQHPTKYPFDALLLGKSAADLGASGFLRGARYTAFKAGKNPILGMTPAESALQAFRQRPLMKPPLRTHKGLDAEGNTITVPGLYSRNPGRFLFQKARDSGKVGFSRPDLAGADFYAPGTSALTKMTAAPRGAMLGWRDMASMLLPKSEQKLLSPEKMANLAAEHERFARRGIPGATDIKATQVNPVARAADTLKRATSTGYFFLKPGYYLPNMLGQGVIAATEYGPIFAKTLAHDLPKMWSKLTPEERKLWMQQAGTGIGRSLEGEKALSGGHPLTLPLRAAEKGVEAVHGGLAKFYSDYLGLDKPWRLAAVLREAQRQGYGSVRDFRTLLNSPQMKAAMEAAPPTLRSAMERGKLGGLPLKDLEGHSLRMADVSRRASKAMIDFEKMLPGKHGAAFERALRRIMFIGAWTAAASRYGGHLALEHPAALEAQLLLGEKERQRAQHQLPFVPSFLPGLMSWGKQHVPGLGDVPTITNPQAASVLGTPAETLKAAQSLVSYNPLNTYNFANLINPVYANAIAAAYGINPETGTNLPPGTMPQRFASLMENSLPQVQAAKRGAFNFIPGMPKGGGKNPQSILFPMTPSQAFARFSLGAPFVPIPINPVESESRRRADIIKGLTKDQSIAMNETWNRTDFLNKYNRVADMIGAKRLTHNFPLVKEGFHHAAVIAQAANELKSNPKAVDRTGRLTAAGQLAATAVALADAGLMDKKEVEKTIEQVLAVDVNLPENEKRLRSLRSNLMKNPKFEHFFDSITSVNDFSKKLNYAANAYKIPYAQRGKDLIQLRK